MKKRIAFLCIVLVAIVCIWLWFRHGNVSKEKHPVVVTADQREMEANATATMTSTSGFSHETNLNTAVVPLNAIVATNLEQWKTIIPGLHYSDTFGDWESWVRQEDSAAGIPVLLSKDKNQTIFKVAFIDVDVLKSGEMQKSELHSGRMDISQTREHGLQLCKLLGIDPAKFLAWCDKVGNSWMDAPLFSSGGSRDIENNRIYSFGVARTYNDQNPWYIDFIISQQ